MFAHTLPPRPGHATQQIKTIIPEVVSDPHPLPLQVPEAAAQEEGRQGGRRRRQERVDQSGGGFTRDPAAERLVTWRRGFTILALDIAVIL